MSTKKKKGIGIDFIVRHEDGTELFNYRVQYHREKKKLIFLPDGRFIKQTLETALNLKDKLTKEEVTNDTK